MYLLSAGDRIACCTAAGLLEAERKFKRGIVGTWHKVSAKHVPAYLDEMCSRFNNPKSRFFSAIRF